MGYIPNPPFSLAAEIKGEEEGYHIKNTSNHGQTMIKAEISNALEQMFQHVSRNSFWMKDLLQWSHIR